MRIPLWFPLLLLLPSACAIRPRPLAPEKLQEGRRYTSVSLLAEELVLDLALRPFYAPREASLDASAWKINESLRKLLEEALLARGRDYSALQLEEGKLEELARIREGRWKRSEGKFPQAQLDHLLRAAREQGIDRLFLLTPVESSERFPTHAGAMGVYCYDRGKKTNRAALYFSFRFSLWEVAGARKLFEHVVDPSVTEPLSFGECRLVTEAREPLRELEDPFKKSLGLIVDALFDKMGWKKP